MGLITIAQLEEALVEELNAEETAHGEYCIRVVSTYVRSYTGISFEPTTSTFRAKSDYYGIIELMGHPIHEILDVTYVHDGSAPWDWHWDGMNEIYGLSPRVAVDVTYEHGYVDVPEDITMLVTEASKRLFLLPDGQERGPLSKYRVGDVEEMYKPPWDTGIGGLFNDLERLILDEYRTQMQTWRVGFAQTPHPPSIPESDDALFE